jgi:hypothetical protein
MLTVHYTLSQLANTISINNLHSFEEHFYLKNKI